MALGYGAPSTAGPVQQGFNAGDVPWWQRLQISKWLTNAQTPLIGQGTQGVPDALNPDAQSAYQRFTGQAPPNYGDFSSYQPPPVVPQRMANSATSVAADINMPLGREFNQLSGSYVPQGADVGFADEKSQINPATGAEPVSPAAQAHNHQMFFAQHPDAMKHAGLAALGTMLGGFFGGIPNFGAGAAQGFAKGVNDQDEFNRRAQEEDLARQQQQDFGMRQLAEQARLREQEAAANFARGRHPFTMNGQEMQLTPEEQLGFMRTQQEGEHQKFLEEHAGDPQLQQLIEGAKALQIGQPQAQERMMMAMMPNMKGMFGPSPTEQLIHQQIVKLLAKRGLISSDDNGASAKALDDRIAAMRPEQRYKFVDEQLKEAAKGLTSADPAERQRAQEARTYLQSKMMGR